jgi:hypothetical protein
MAGRVPPYLLGFCIFSMGLLISTALDTAVYDGCIELSFCSSNWNNQCSCNNKKSVSSRISPIALMFVTQILQLKVVNVVSCSCFDFVVVKEWLGAGAENLCFYICFAGDFCEFYNLHFFWVSFDGFIIF